MTDFAAVDAVDAVDAGVARDLVAMMDATDAWPAVRAARAWVLEHAAPGDLAVVVDAGCGPGTFGASVPGCVLDVDWSLVMLQEVRRRRADARTVAADLAHLPLREGAAGLVHVERVLQWTDDPVAVLAELRRALAPGGWLAVTDTDWGTFAVDHPDAAAGDRLRAAAGQWVPHARFARDLPATLRALGGHDVQTRHDTVSLTAWDPDDPAQHDGPPGLPLHSIAGPLTPELVPVAARARGGEFLAEVTLVTCISRR
jgi:SAM-dependent methyltransferase